MGKKFIIIILIIIICIAILAGVIFIKNSNTGIKSYLIKDEYDSIDSEIISTYEEYQEFVEYINQSNGYNFNSNRYDSGYFNSKSLAIINIIGEIKDIEFFTESNKLICNVELEYKVNDMARGHVYLVEIDKDIIDFNINRRYS